MILNVLFARQRLTCRVARPLGPRVKTWSDGHLGSLCVAGIHPCFAPAIAHIHYLPGFSGYPGAFKLSGSHVCVNMLRPLPAFHSSISCTWFRWYTGPACSPGRPKSNNLPRSRHPRAGLVGLRLPTHVPAGPWGFVVRPQPRDAPRLYFCGLPISLGHAIERAPANPSWLSSALLRRPPARWSYIRNGCNSEDDRPCKVEAVHQLHPIRSIVHV